MLEEIFPAVIDPVLELSGVGVNPPILFEGTMLKYDIHNGWWSQSFNPLLVIVGQFTHCVDRLFRQIHRIESSNRVIDNVFFCV
jgi:hypothetical protein